MIIRKIILSSLFFWSVPAFCFQSDDNGKNTLNDGFHLVKDIDNIKVYHKTSPKKGYVEYKAITILNESNIDEVLNFFVDYKSHPEWVYNCIESYGQEKNGNTYLYQVCKSPWPMKNRDLSLKVETKKIDDTTVVVNFISEPDALQLNIKNVRIFDFHSSWWVQQLKEKVSVTVYASFNPKLSIGNFMLKSYATKIPFETLKSLKASYYAKM